MSTPAARAGAPAARADTVGGIALLLTDIVDSAALTQRLGDEAAADLWSAHDRTARALLRRWRGREVDKSDGFLLLFASPADALGYAGDYHRALAALPTPMRARAGLHVCAAATPPTSPGAPAPDPAAKAVAARVMAIAGGGQTLVTAAAAEVLQATTGVALPHRLVPLGFWRIKGLPDALELHAVALPDAPDGADADVRAAAVAPPPDDARAWRVVRRDDLWLPVRPVPHRLPAERDGFVGRGDVLAEIAARFDGGARLVSLIGPVGAGKSRTAGRFGWIALGDFPGGAWWCDLSAARGLDGLVAAVAAGFGVPLLEGDPVEQLGHAIAARGPTLLVLDHAQQVARHGEATVGRWLARARQARVLVTSREALDVPGEQVVALDPLADRDAEALFHRRAAAWTGDPPAPADRAAVAALVGLLDGQPLAIELLAAQAGRQPLPALLSGLLAHLPPPSELDGWSDRPPALAGVLDLLWGGLPPPTRTVLAQLAVFEGGFTDAAAAAVVHPAIDVASRLDTLVGARLVVRRDDGRCALPPGVRVYADAQLAAPGRFQGSGPAARAAVQARHAAWCATLVPGPEDDPPFAEVDNLIAACRVTVAAGAADAAAGALQAAWSVLARRGPLRLALGLAEAACAQPDASPPAASRTQRVLGEVLARLGRADEAMQPLAAALASAGRAGQGELRADAWLAIGTCRRRAGQWAEAEAALAQALAESARAGDTLRRAATWSEQARAACQAGRLDAAEACCRTGLALANAHGAWRLCGELAGTLGVVLAAAGRPAEARAALDDALRVARRRGDRLAEVTLLCNRAALGLVPGAAPGAARGPGSGAAVDPAVDPAWTTAPGAVPDGAQREAPGLGAADAEAALACARELGLGHLEGVALGLLARFHAAAGRDAEAGRCAEQAIAAASRSHDRRTSGDALLALGLEPAA